MAPGVHAFSLVVVLAAFAEGKLNYISYLCESSKRAVVSVLNVPVCGQSQDVLWESFGLVLVLKLEIRSVKRGICHIARSIINELFL